MKVIKVLAAILGAGVVLVAIAASMQPDTTHIERSKTIAASPADVFPLINDFANWNQWDPWSGMDPDQKVELSTPSSGKGAWYTWNGEKTGQGRQEITESDENAKVVESLDFIKPFTAHATVSFTMSAEGDGTKVVWGYDTENGFMSKVFGLFNDMDAMLGADFEKGLNKLGPLAEANAKTRMEAEAAAAAAAAAATAAVDPNASADGAAAATPASSSTN